MCQKDMEGKWSIILTGTFSLFLKLATVFVRGGGQGFHRSTVRN